MGNDEEQRIKLNQADKFAMIPHLADEELTVWEYRLYGHYVRRAGEGDNDECFERVSTTCAWCDMGEHKMRQARQGLIDKGYILAEFLSGGTVHITVLDQWKRNRSLAGKRSIEELLSIRNDQPVTPPEKRRKPVTHVEGVTHVELPPVTHVEGGRYTSVIQRITPERENPLEEDISPRPNGAGLRQGNQPTRSVDATNQSSPQSQKSPRRSPVSAGQSEEPPPPTPAPKPKTDKQLEDGRIWEMCCAFCRYKEVDEKKYAVQFRGRGDKGTIGQVAKAYPDLTPEQFEAFLMDYKQHHAGFTLEKPQTIIEKLVTWLEKGTTGKSSNGRRDTTMHTQDDPVSIYCNWQGVDRETAKKKGYSTMMRELRQAGLWQD